MHRAVPILAPIGDSSLALKCQRDAAERCSSSVDNNVAITNPVCQGNKPTAADEPGWKRFLVSTESTEMKRVNEVNIDVAGNSRGYSDECAQAVQTDGKVKMSQGVLKRLVSWMANCLEAHNDRVVALSVYRRDRLDGSSHNDAPIDRMPQSSAGSRPV